MIPFMTAADSLQAARPLGRPSGWSRKPMAQGLLI